MLAVFVHFFAGLFCMAVAARLYLVPGNVRFEGGQPVVETILVILGVLLILRGIQLQGRS